MRGRKVRFLTAMPIPLVAATMTILAVLVAPTPADAVTTETTSLPGSPSGPVRITVPMSVVKVGTISGRQVSPLNTVGGNCGTSYVYINPAGNGQANISVGFNLNIVANWYTASTYAYGSVENNFTNNSGWLGFLGSGSNSYSNDFTTYLGPGFASVAAYLTAENLGTGEECQSTFPTATTYLY